MKKSKFVVRGIGLLSTLIVAFAVGCGSHDVSKETVEAGETAAASSVSEDISNESVKVVAETETEVLVKTDDISEPVDATHIIKDMAGREVEVPVVIEKAFSVNNNGTILLYTLCPDKMIGWNSKMSEKVKAYMDESVANLPMLGALYGNSSQSNPEGVIMNQPDIILFMDAKADEKIVKAADKIQSEMKIPVVVVKGNLKGYDKAYKFVGKLLDMEEEALILSDYYSESINRVTSIVESIPKEDRVRVYYAREEDGLSTESVKSPNAQLISLCGGVNVAAMKDTSIKSPIVSIEQVMTWNPEVIFTGNGGFVSYGTYQEVTTNEQWSNIQAVADGKVYPTPQLPFNWFDRPPSVNRIIGINYVLYTLYPEYYEGDIVEDVVTFYDLFYHYELSREEANILLNIGEE